MVSMRCPTCNRADNGRLRDGVVIKCRNCGYEVPAQSLLARRSTGDVRAAMIEAQRKINSRHALKEAGFVLGKADG